MILESLKIEAGLSKQYENNKQQRSEQEFNIQLLFRGMRKNEAS